MAHRYRLYGLCIESSRPIALLDPVDDAVPDVIFDWCTGSAGMFDGFPWRRLDSADLRHRRTITVDTAEAAGERWYKVRYVNRPATFDLIVNASGSRASIVRDAAMPIADCESFLVGPIMGAILRLRGTLALHASAVEIDGRAIAFAGCKYSGKSTHAAAFFKRGNRVLADDIGALTASETGFNIEPGYSRLRVRTGTAELVSANPGALPRVYSQGDSFYTELGGAFQPGAIPLAGVYLLSREAAGGALTSPLSSIETMARLGQNTMGNHMVSPTMRRDEFALLARLAAEVPVRQLQVRDTLSHLDAQCDAVLDDLARELG